MKCLAGPGRSRLVGRMAILAFLLTSAPVVDLSGQGAPRLVVGEDRLVSADETGLTHVEPHLAVHPEDPDHLAVASIVFRDGRMTSEVLLSPDGGERWSRTRFPECAGDPWLAWGSAENVYFSCLGAGGAPVRTLIHRSGDGGRSWSAAVELPRGGGGSFDHTSMAVLPRPDSGDIVYVGGMQGLRAPDRPPLSAAFLAVSRDGARRFEAPHRFVWSDVMANALNPVVLGVEGVGLPFVDFSVGGRSLIDHPRIWWVRSEDRARSFSLLHLVTDATGMGTGPVMAGAVREPDAADLYLAYDNVQDGRQGVYLVRSGDGGKTWSAPVAVSAGATRASRAANPMTAVDPAGNVGVAWYERPPERQAGCWRIRFTLSMDRGASFLEPVTVSSEPFCAREGEVARADRWPAGGDYFGLAAFAEGAFRVVWADSRTGVYQARTAAVRVRGPRAEDGRPDPDAGLAAPGSRPSRTTRPPSP